MVVYVVYMQVWQWMDQELKELPLEELGTFDSSHIYLVQHTEHKETPLYTWFEGTVFVWVGAGVIQRKDAVVDAIHKAKNLGTTSKTVCIPQANAHSQTIMLVTSN